MFITEWPVSLQLHNMDQILWEVCVLMFLKYHYFMNIKHITLYTYVMYKNVV
jgi:hypothetical protein